MAGAESAPAAATQAACVGTVRVLKTRRERKRERGDKGKGLRGELNSGAEYTPLRHDVSTYPCRTLDRGHICSGLLPCKRNCNHEPVTAMRAVFEPVCTNHVTSFATQSNSSVCAPGGSGGIAPRTVTVSFGLTGAALSG